MEHKPIHMYPTMLTTLLTGIAIGVSVGWALFRRKEANDETTASGLSVSNNAMEMTPECWRGLFTSPAHKRVHMREWEDPAWRHDNGWLGNDLIHNAASKGVRILAYFWDDSTQELTGFAHFGVDSESHR